MKAEQMPWAYRPSPATLNSFYLIQGCTLCQSVRVATRKTRRREASDVKPADDQSLDFRFRHRRKLNTCLSHPGDGKL